MSDLYELRPRKVRAWRLDWSNWQELADRVHGKFHQSLQLDRSAMRQRMPNQGRAYLEVPIFHPDADAERWERQVCKIGDWVVEETPGRFAVWDATDFDETFQPAPIIIEPLVATLPRAEMESIDHYLEQ